MRSEKRPPRPALLALVAYGGALVWLAGAGATDPPGGAEGLRAQLVANPLGLLRDLTLGALARVARFAPLGVFAVLAMGWQGTWLERFVKTWVPGLGLALALAVGVVGFEGGGGWSRPGVLDLALPALGCVLGAWLGLGWTKGWASGLWVLPKAALLFLLLASGAAALVFAAADSEPLAFEPAPVSSSDRRRLYRTFKDKNPAALPEGKTAELRLTDRDLNQLLAWGLALGEPGRKANVELTPDAATLSASAGLPASRHLNVIASADASVEDGRLSVFPFRLRVGRFEVPVWILDRASPLAIRMIAADRRVDSFLAPIRRLKLGDQALTVVYAHAEPPPGFLAQLFQGEGAGEEDLAAIRAHVQNLLESAKSLPRDGEARFGKALETAFHFARERSKEGQAVGENRAAVLALGMLLGHRRVETFVGGGVLDPATLQNAARSFHGTTLRGRNDWPKHFFVSASLSLLAVGDVSDAAGVLKEELDASGGSGFSFGDLLADRAGVTFAATATRDEPTARAFQDRLARGFRVDDFFPPARGLPEGLPDAELQTRYGGVGGEGYRRLADEIERRIQSCAAYRL